jgi:hypothetical protein
MFKCRKGPEPQVILSRLRFVSDFTVFSFHRTWNLVKGRSAYTTNLHAQGEDVAFSETGELYAVLKLIKGGAQFSVDVYGVEVAGIMYSIVTDSRASCVTFLKVIIDSLK